MAKGVVKELVQVDVRELSTDDIVSPYCQTWEKLKYSSPRISNFENNPVSQGQTTSSAVTINWQVYQWSWSLKKK